MIHQLFLLKAKLKKTCSKQACTKHSPKINKESASIFLNLEGQAVILK